MSSRELVIDLVNQLPEDTTLAEIVRQVELPAGIQMARPQARQRQGVPAEATRKLVETRASR